MANKNQGGARSGYTLAVNRQSFEPHSQDDAFHPIKHSKEALARITIGSCRSDVLEALEREDQVDLASVPQFLSLPTGIHQSIHQSILHSSLDLTFHELYRNKRPRLYPCPKPKKMAPQVVYPVPLSGPDYYLAIAVFQASAVLKGIPVYSSDILKQCISCSPVAHLSLLQQGFTSYLG